MSARWTPAADRVVVAGMAPGRAQRLYRLNLRGGQPEPFTPEGVVTWVISPDGRFVAFTGAGRGVTVQSVDGSTARTIPGTTGTENLLAWVASGVLVLRPDTPGDVRLLDVGTGRQTQWAKILPQDRVGIMALASFAVTPDGATRACTWHRALSDLYLADGLA